MQRDRIINHRYLGHRTNFKIRSICAPPPLYWNQIRPHYFYGKFWIFSIFDIEGFGFYNRLRAGKVTLFCQVSYLTEWRGSLSLEPPSISLIYTLALSPLRTRSGCRTWCCLNINFLRSLFASSLNENSQPPLGAEGNRLLTRFPLLRARTILNLWVVFDLE